MNLVQIHAAKLAGILASLLLALPPAATAQSISEETPPATCGNRLVTGITCSGRYCDNLQPICGTARHEIFDIRWSAFVSEEGNALARCNVANPFERVDWPAGEPLPAMVTSPSMKSVGASGSGSGSQRYCSGELGASSKRLCRCGCA